MFVEIDAEASFGEFDDLLPDAEWLLLEFFDDFPAGRRIEGEIVAFRALVAEGGLRGSFYLDVDGFEPCIAMGATFRCFFSR